MTENVADIEVTMMETHANLKIRTKKRPRQLLKLVASFQSLRLTVLHLNVSTLDQTVLYSVSVKVKLTINTHHSYIYLHIINYNKINIYVLG